MAGTSEFQVMNTATATEELPAQYTGCHSHGTEMYELSLATTRVAESNRWTGTVLTTRARNTSLCQKARKRPRIMKIMTMKKNPLRARARAKRVRTATSMPALSKCNLCPSPESMLITASKRHCVGAGESESGGTRSCERTDREYNVPLRIGLLFVVLVTSAIGMFNTNFEFSC